MGAPFRTYRSRAVDVEAVRWDGKSRDWWAGDQSASVTSVVLPGGRLLTVKVPSGEWVDVRPGEWVIRQPGGCYRRLTVDEFHRAYWRVANLGGEFEDNTQGQKPELIFEIEDEGDHKLHSIWVEPETIEGREAWAVHDSREAYPDHFDTEREALVEFWTRVGLLAAWAVDDLTRRSANRQDVPEGTDY